jgi:hypothetical protein
MANYPALRPTLGLLGLGIVFALLNVGTCTAWCFGGAAIGALTMFVQYQSQQARPRAVRDSHASTLKNQPLYHPERQMTSSASSQMLVEESTED